MIPRGYSPLSYQLGYPTKIKNLPAVRLELTLDFSTGSEPVASAYLGYAGENGPGRARTGTLLPSQDSSSALGYGTVGRCWVRTSDLVGVNHAFCQLN
jgi:hypothetical protein